LTSLPSRGKVRFMDEQDDLSRTRKRVLKLLTTTELSYAAIGRALGISKQRVHQHVVRLREMGLLK
jgi:biotin operon repressor